jgi:hypothetical protein
MVDVAKLLHTRSGKDKGHPRTGHEGPEGSTYNNNNNNNNKLH